MLDSAYIRGCGCGCVYDFLTRATIRVTVRGVTVRGIGGEVGGVCDSGREL
jgi:hypothetical protein